MILVLLAALVFCGLRLWGVTNNFYQAIAHCFVGGLAGYALATWEWMVVVSFVLLCVTELYMVAAKFFPQISLPTLAKKL